MLEQSAYSILGVHKGISDKDLKLAYVNLVKKYDPEKHTDRFMVIQGAYDRLKNVKSRVKEDVFTHNIVKGDYLIPKEEQCEEGETIDEADVAQARAAYRENPGDEEAKKKLCVLLSKRAHYHVIRRQHAEAVRDWSEILEIEPTNMRARQNLELANSNLGVSYALHGLEEDAIEAWERVLELNPDNVDVMHNIALTAEKLKDTHKADRYWTETIKRWKAKLETNRDDDYLRLIIVEALNHQAEYQEDHPELSEREDQKPSSGSSSSVPKNSYEQRSSSSSTSVPRQTTGSGQPGGEAPPKSRTGAGHGKSSKTVQRIRSGATKGEDGPSASALSGIERYREILKLQPDDFEAHFQLCNKLMELKMWEEALKELEALARKNKNNTEVLNLMGWALLNNRQKEKAFACWKRSLAIDPKNSATRDNLVRANLSLGKSYREKGLFTPAMVHFKQLLSLMPKSPEVHLEIAATYDMKGDVRSALAAYNQVLSIDPKNKVARRAISDLRTRR